MSDQQEAPDLNSPERTKFYEDQAKRERTVRATFSVTVEADTSMMKADLEATIRDGLRAACLKVVRVKQLPGV